MKVPWEIQTEKVQQEDAMLTRVRTRKTTQKNYEK